MLEKITLINFQKHQNLVIDLDPCVTTLIGPSDIGKSSCIRGLEWICLNQPAGIKDILKDNEERVKVLLYADGHKIIRNAGKGGNYYKLDKRKYKAFGRNVPDDISNLLNVTDKNFQFQHDSHFWFSLPASHVSKELNQIFSLGVIDSTLADLASQLRQARSFVQVSKSRLEKAKKEKEELAWVLEVDKALRPVEQLEVQAKATREKATLLASQLQKAAKYQEGAKTLRAAVVVADRCLKTASKALDARQRVEKLQSAIQELDKAWLVKNECQSQLDTAKQEYRNKTKDQQCPICFKPM